MVAGLTDVPAFGGSGHPCAGMSLGLKVLVLCAAMSACEAEESGGGQRGAVSESDQGGPLGAGAVESDARKEPRRYRLSDQPLLQIGSAAGDGEVAFHGITGAVRLPSGHIVVANSGAWELKFFDPHGGFLAVAGRYGDGPGDFRSLSRIGALREDRVAAVDRLVGRVSVFSSDGVLERTYNVSQVLGGVGRGTEWYGFLANGTLVGVETVAGRGTEARYGDYPTSALVYKVPIVQPVLIDSLGQAVPFARTMPGDETLSEMRMSSEDGMMRVGGVRTVMPFLNSAAVAVRGSSVAVGHTSASPITLYSAQGRPRAFFALEMESLEDPEGKRRAWIDDRTSGFGDRGVRRIWRARYEEFMSATPASLPAFKSLLLQEGGNVWVEVFDPSADANTPSRWIVQDPFNVGDFEDAIVELPPGFRPYDIGSDYVLGEWRDELGVEFVQMYGLIEVASDR